MEKVSYNSPNLQLHSPSLSAMVGVMENRELMYLHGFNLLSGVGAVSLRAVKEHFGTYEQAWRASDGEYVAVTGLKPQYRHALLEHRRSTRPEEQFEKLLKSGIWIIGDFHDNYPDMLTEIPNAPVALYGRGTIENIGTSIGIVGTRRPTTYGIEATQALVDGLVAATGLTITSGLASGIDTIAHETSLQGKGRTIAVLGSAVDDASVFPAQNRWLATRIAESGGAVISEYPPGTQATQGYFPQRNRIISGISRGVLVVEAREKSGALITARYALEQNRDVFAVPGSIFSLTSRGSNRLIQEGAKAVCSAEDLLEELGIEYTKETRANQNSALNKDEQAIWLLLEQPCTVDELKQAVSLDTKVIISIISMLELKGLIRNMGQDTYQKI